MTFYVPSSALVIVAHPDDIEFGSAGTVARWIKYGCRAGYLLLTSGDVGIAEPGMTKEQARDIRETEQRAAAELIGVAEVIFLREPDGMLQPTGEAMSSLVSYPWPGNIRQLYNVCERIVLLARSDLIDEAMADFVLVTEAQGQAIEVLPQDVPRQAVPEAPPASSIVRSYSTVGSAERSQIQAALATHGGNKSRTAKALNLTLRQLNYRIQVLGIAVQRSNNV